MLGNMKFYKRLTNLNFLVILAVSYRLMIRVQCAEYRTFDVASGGDSVNSDKKSEFSPRSGTLDIRSRYWTTSDDVQMDEPEVSGSSTYATLSSDNGEYVRSVDSSDDQHAYVSVDRMDKEHLVTINMPRMQMDGKGHLIRKFVIQPVIQYVVQYDKNSRNRDSHSSASNQFDEFEGAPEHDRLRRGHDARIDRYFNDVDAQFESYWGNTDDNNEGGGGYQQQDNGGYSSGGDGGGNDGGDSGGYMTTGQNQEPPNVNAYVSAGGYGQQSSNSGSNTGSGMSLQNAMQVSGQNQQQPQPAPMPVYGPPQVQMMPSGQSGMMGVSGQMGDAMGQVAPSMPIMTGQMPTQNPGIQMAMNPSAAPNPLYGVPGMTPGQPMGQQQMMMVPMPSPASNTMAMGQAMGQQQQQPQAMMMMTMPGGMPVMPQGGQAMNIGMGNAMASTGGASGTSSGAGAMMTNAMGMGSGMTGNAMPMIVPTMSAMPMVSTMSSISGGSGGNMMSGGVGSASVAAQINSIMQANNAMLMGMGGAGSAASGNAGMASTGNTQDISPSYGPPPPSIAPSYGPPSPPPSSSTEAPTQVAPLVAMPMSTGQRKPRGRGRGAKSILANLPKLPSTIGGHLSFMFSTGFGKGRRGNRGGSGGNTSSSKSADKALDKEQVSDHILNFLGLAVTPHPPPLFLLNPTNANATNNNSSSASETILASASNIIPNLTNPVLLWELQPKPEVSNSFNPNATYFTHLTSHLTGDILEEAVGHLLPIPEAFKAEPEMETMTTLATTLSSTSVTPTMTTTTGVPTTLDTTITTQAVTTISSTTPNVPTTSTSTMSSTPTQEMTTTPTSSMSTSPTPEMTTVPSISTSTPTTEVPSTSTDSTSTTLPPSSTEPSTIPPSTLPTTTTTPTPDILFLPPPTPAIPLPYPPAIFFTPPPPPTSFANFNLHTRPQDPLQEYINQNLSNNIVTLQSSSPTPFFQPNIKAYFANADNPQSTVQLMPFDPWIYNALQSAFQPGQMVYDGQREVYFQTLVKHFNKKRKRSRNYTAQILDIRPSESREFHQDDINDTINLNPMARLALPTKSNSVSSLNDKRSVTVKT